MTFFNPRGGPNLLLCFSSLALLFHGADASWNLRNDDLYAMDLRDLNEQTSTGAESAMPKDEFMAPNSPIQHYQRGTA